jgi:hypothetical protein
LKNILAIHSELVSTKGESTGIFSFRDFSTYSSSEVGVNESHKAVVESLGVVEAYDKLTLLFTCGEKSLTFVDKVTPSLLRYAYLSNRFPEALFVHIVRGGRDAYCSGVNNGGIRQAASVKKFSRY